MVNLSQVLTITLHLSLLTIAIVIAVFNLIYLLSFGRITLKINTTLPQVVKKLLIANVIAAIITSLVIAASLLFR